MNTENVVAKIKKLQPLLDMSGFALKHPNCEEQEVILAEAEYWLDELISDFMGQFEAVYELEHTGVEFWDTVQSLGLQDEHGLMADLDVCIQMRKILKKFKRRCVKQLPVLFGGVKRGKAKAKSKKASIR